ncbi:subtilisin-like serine peptidase [Leishmania tarentolae]|uniref:Subtilisin-like serine peptidase n=1 Tax=Leishmania tarentolae TaxID=5689 RepID=A0A640KD37_LEITA|nr:subtilisin-like serine peptidase [Leishmania tarentolae]
METVIAQRLLTVCIRASLFLVLLSFPVAEGPWPLAVQAVRPSTATHGDGPSIHPREYYLGKYGTRCMQNLPKLVTSEDSAEHLACFSGRGVRVALLDTGLCAGITERSRNAVTCTSVVPDVKCEDAGCAHGTRSVSVLAGQLSVTTPRARAPLPESAWHNRGTRFASADEYVGLAPDSTVRVLRIFDQQGRTNRRHLVRALDLLLSEAEDGEAGRLHNTWNTSRAYMRSRDEAVDVISLSYGSKDYLSSPQVQNRLYRLMHEYGVIVVAAAGNDGVRLGSVRSPADMPGVLAVGALQIEGHRRSAQKPQASRTLGAFASPLVAGGSYKSVAQFSGRGPTTWELPFGAGRVKPDLVALGQRVWAVQGVSTVTSSAAAPRARNVSPTLQLFSASGTSIAAPIVAGVVALCLEAAWSSTPAAASVQNTTGGVSFLDLRRNRLARVAVSLRVREAILRTAVPLEEDAVSLPSWPYSTSVTPLHSNTSSTASEGHPRRVLAGVPLVQLYADYLRLSRVSILAQGAGEVKPLRALRAIIDKALVSSASDTPESLRSCASFAIPTSMRIGYGIPRGNSSVGVSIPQSCHPSHDPDGKACGDSPLSRLPGKSLAALPAAYWWPFSDEAVYPGATPVLLNFSLHLCPSSSAAADHGEGDAASTEGDKAVRRESTTHTHATYVFTKVSGCTHAREGHSSGNSTQQDDACPLILFRAGSEIPHCERSPNPTRPLNLTARSSSHRASSLEGDAIGEEGTAMGQPSTQGVCSPAKRWNTQQRWLDHLLRVSTELTVVARRSPTYESVAEQLSPPPTSFSLSVAVSSPASAHTHLCYNVARETVEMRRGRGTRSPAGEKGAAASRSSADRHEGNGVQHSRDEVQAPDDHSSCVPLFHLCRALNVEGAVHIFSGSSSSKPVLTVPFTVRVAEPPPRVQRVLIDTSLDWFNPITSTSNLFIAGDDPHESDAGVGAALQRGRQAQRHERAYAEESGGDHPYASLALLCLYLRHALGMAVQTFPILHMSTMSTSSAANGTSAPWPSAERTSNVSHIAQSASAGALAHVGTLIVVDPERPLSRTMRRLLSDAVLSGGPNRSADGLNVLLVTDWFSAEVAARLRWTRDERSDSTERPARTNGTDAADVGGDRDTVRDLRAFRQLENGSTRGLAGSSHVPSWNRWLSEVTAASGSAFHNSDCDHVAHRHIEGLTDAACGSPFELSESIVIDGVMVVDAAAPTRKREPEGNESATHDGGSGTVTSAKTVALRSLGHLNAAGVLQWRLPVQATVLEQARRGATVKAFKEAHASNVHSNGNGTRRTDYTSNTPALPSTQKGEAVICNVMASWAQQQRRLVKRIIASTRNSSAQASSRSGTAASGAEALVVEDGWEKVPTPNGEERRARIGSLEAVEISTEVPAATGASKATQSLSHGVLGFLTLPPPPTHVAAASVNRFRPGRIAIFTDSDCLSASNPHVQAALDELEALLYPTPLTTCATWERFASSVDGQRLLQAESAQSSMCVEVVKELLLWLHTGNLDRWRDSAQLQCEARTWARALHRSAASSTPATGSVLEPHAKTDSEDGAREAVNADDVIGTAPERAHVGGVVWRLWSSTMESTEGDAMPFSFEGAEEETRCRGDYVIRQESAASHVMRALKVNYHGDWRAHLADGRFSCAAVKHQRR